MFLDHLLPWWLPLVTFRPSTFVSSYCPAFLHLPQGHPTPIDLYFSGLDLLFCFIIHNLLLWICLAQAWCALKLGFVLYCVLAPLTSSSLPGMAVNPRHSCKSEALYASEPWTQPLPQELWFLFLENLLRKQTFSFCVVTAAFCFWDIPCSYWQLHICTCMKYVYTHMSHINSAGFGGILIK